MIGFSDAKSILSTVTEIIKKSATLDLHEKIVDLREYLIDLKDQNVLLKEENQAIKAQLSLRNEFVFRGGFYWRDEDSVPFCQACMDSTSKPVRLQAWGSGRKCFVCSSFFDGDRPGYAKIIRPSFK